MTSADDIHKHLNRFCLSEKKLDIICGFSARQRIHRNDQALFSSKDKSYKNIVSSAEFVIWHFKD